MQIDGIKYPRKLIDAVKEDKLVVFVGAGVSVGEPTSLPTFTGIVDYIAKDTSYSFDEKNEQHDAFLGKLEHSGINVKQKTARFFMDKDANPNDLHKYITDLFKDKTKIRIVTTNYDNMIEKSLGNTSVSIFNAPALPLGNDFTGIVHIHGSQNDPKHMIITDSDFGAAYLLDGYVTRFLVKLFEEYTVLFIGYSYNDTVIKYLSRALPDKQKEKRFILTDDDSKEWDILGIIPLLYPKKGFNILYNSLKKFGSRVNRNMMGWKNRCAELSKLPPPKDVGIIDEIYEIFFDAIILEFFLENLEIKNYNLWIDWLNENGLLDFVTKECVLNKSEKLLCEWIIRNDIKETNFKKIFEIIFKKNNKVNHNFIIKILSFIGYSKVEISDEVYTKCIIFFKNNLKKIDKYCLINILKICSERELDNLVWNIFRVIVEPTFKLEIADYDLIYEGKYNFSIDTYLLRQAWNKNIKQYLGLFSYKIVFLLEDIFERLQVDFKKFNQENKEYDVYTFFGDIESEMLKKEPRESIYVLCLIMFESLGYIDANDSIFYKNIIERLIKSLSPTLKRLALISLRESRSYTVSEKIKIMFEEIDIYDVHKKTEIFRLVGKLFNCIDKDLQNELLSKILSKLENIDSKEEEKNRYQVYNLFVYLMRENPDNELLSSTYNKYSNLFSSFSPIKDPELILSQVEVEWGKDATPISIKQLQVMPINEVVKLIEPYSDEGKKFDSDISRKRLLNAIHSHVMSNFSWNKELMSALLVKGNFKIDVWTYLLKELGRTNLSKDDLNFVLNLICSKGFIQHNGVVVSDLLKDLVDNKLIYEEWIDDFKKTTLKIINLLYYNPTYNVPKHDSFVTIDRNSTSYSAALCLLSIIDKKNIDFGIPQEYKNLIKTYLSSNEKEAIYFRCITLNFYLSLYNRDSDWVRLEIFPLLKDKDTLLFQAAWEGMLTSYSPTIYPDVAEALNEYYLLALGRMEEFTDTLKEMFVKSLGVLIIYYIPKPNESVVPLLFKTIDSKLKSVFLNKIRKVLENMSDSERKITWERWLFKFVENINLNIPASLNNEELIIVMSWLPYAGEYFSQFVEEISQFKKIKFWAIYQFERILKNIRERKEFDDMDNSKIDLLKYILECDFENMFSYKEFENFYNSITFNSLKDKDEIIELALKKRIRLREGNNILK